MSAYPQAVQPYRNSGLGYPLPLRPGTKAPPPTGYTGVGGAFPSDADYDEWIVDYPTGNVALRLAPHVVGVDVDAYEKNGKRKQGAETLAKLEAAHGSLPATWASTARHDGISGIRLYTADPALIEQFPGSAGADIEIIRYGHRYMVTYPSIHPEGSQYRLVSPDGSNGQLPTPDDLPVLPDNWIRHLIAGDHCPCNNNGDVTRTEWGSVTLKPAKYGDVQAAVSALEHALNGGGSRHDTATSATMALLRFAERGDPSAATELERLRPLYIDAVAADRDGGRKAAEREWERMTRGAERKVAADPSRIEIPTTSTDPEPATVDKYLRHTDVDNSTRFTQLHGAHLRYVPIWKRWLIWNQHAWVIDEDKVRVLELGKGISRALYREAAELADSDKANKVASWAKQSSSANRIEAAVKLARGIDGVSITHTDLDTDPWLLGVQDGVIDLRTGQHRPGDPADLMHKQAGTGYDPDADCPTWRRCMEQWFPDDDTRRYVQRLSGSALVGKQKDHKFVIHYGDGGNGKGTYVRAVAHVLGDYFITPDKSLIVHGRYEKHDTERAALFRTRLAVAVETEKRQQLNEAGIKNLTGGDRIHARRLYENPWEFDPSHSMWLQTNYLPEIHGRDTGIWRRIDVVPWVAKFAADAADTDLDDKLRAEAAGILNWLIEGCLEWQRIGLDVSAAVVNATARYREAEDILGRFAQDTGLTFTEGGLITSKKLHGKLADWCEEEGIEDPPKRTEFADWMRSNGAENLGKRSIKGERGTWWRNAGFEETHTQYGLSAEPTPPAPPNPKVSTWTPHMGGLPLGGAHGVGVNQEAQLCPGCGQPLKAIFPSGMCSDCDAEMVAP